MSTSLDEPKHKLVKKPGWAELIACCSLVVMLLGIVTYVVMPLTN